MKVISILNSKGGVGKTTSAVEVAYQLGTVLGKRVLCIDMDPQGNFTEMLTGKLFHQGLYDLLLSESWSLKPSDILKPALSSWQNVVILPADRRLGLIEPHLASKIGKEVILRDLLKPLTTNFDYAIIDLPPTINTLTLNALACSHTYVVPTDLSEYSKSGIEAVQRLADTIVAKGLNKDLVFAGIFVTSFQKGGAIAIRAIMEEILLEFKDKLLDVKINDSVKVLESQKRHVPVGATYPENAVAKAYQRLTEVLQ